MQLGPHSAMPASLASPVMKAPSFCASASEDSLKPPA
jgi:hypothetical protein